MTDPWKNGETQPVPDLAGSIRVYKHLKIEYGQLASPGFKCHWRVHGPMVAECMRSCSGFVPNQHCRCGFYGYYLPDLPPQANYSQQDGGVLAVAEASGRIILAELGLRAQKMQLTAVYIDPGNYSVPWAQIREIKALGLPVFISRDHFLAKYPPRDDISGIAGKTAEQLRDQWVERNKGHEDISQGYTAGNSIPAGGTLSFTPRGVPARGNFSVGHVTATITATPAGNTTTYRALVAVPPGGQVIFGNDVRITSATSEVGGLVIYEVEYN